MTSLDCREPVLLVGGAHSKQADFEAARDFASAVVAVDSGADRLADWGVAPDLVIGDMDSITVTPPETAQIVPIPEQDSTDLEKALREIAAPLYIGIGFIGGRVDHTLAAMHALVRHAERRAVLIGPEDVIFAAPTEWRAEIAEGERISFYPVRRVEAVGSKGLRWPLDGLLLEGGGQIGTSNETVARAIAAWFAEPGAVTILPRRWLGAAVESLA